MTTEGRLHQTPSGRARTWWRPANTAPYPQIGYLDPRCGPVITRISPRLSEVAFETMAPICPVPTWPGQRNHESTYLFSGTPVRCGSHLQEQVLTLLDFQHRFDAVAAQPIWLLWPPTMRTPRHAPTFLARSHHGALTVVDVRAKPFIDQAHRAVFDATAQACAEAGWSHELHDSIAPTLAANLDILARCAHHRYAPSEQLTARLDTAARHRPSLHELTHHIADAHTHTRATTLTAIYHLLWTGRLRVRLDRPLTMTSVIEPP